MRGTIPVDLNSILCKLPFAFSPSDGSSLLTRDWVCDEIVKYRSLLAELYTLAAKQRVSLKRRSYFLQRATYHNRVATKLKSAILDIFWEPSTLAFYDFNLTSDKRNTWFSPAAFYPFWSGIIPPELLDDSVATDVREEKAKGVFAAVRVVMSRYNGTFPASFVQTGLQWDAPK